jgi:uncharacterized protein
MTMQRTENAYAALVTGASSGIGLELARVLAANGHPLAIVAREGARLKAVASRLASEHGVPVASFVADLAALDAPERLWADLEKSGIIVDVLVNNAGIGGYGRFHEASLDALLRMQMVNVLALTTLTRLALPGMIGRRRGRILNVASIVAYMPGAPMMAVYYATKAYVLSLSKGLARELSGSGVSVTALAPGPTATSFDDRAGSDINVLYNRLPKMSAAAVARAGYDGMMRNSMVVIPGLMTKMLAVAGELPPRRIALEVNRVLWARRPQR